VFVVFVVFVLLLILVVFVIRHNRNPGRGRSEVPVNRTKVAVDRTIDAERNRIRPAGPDRKISGSDIFISYASADRETARSLARALSENGWAVWWDRTIPPGKTFDEVIESALDSARCVIVLWSSASVSSRWVKSEAEEAARRQILVPALIQEVRIPLAFRHIQAARLVDWNGSSDNPELEQLMSSVTGILNQGAEGGRRA